jgi:cytochrome bd ubiquinol oxidase subunit II
MSYDSLIVIWFLLLGVLLVGYAILDGFDLGVGILHPFVAKTDEERRIFLNSIGPLWDGNEVWLVTFGGGLFAAFPQAYASVFSGFYTALMLVLVALISRAVSMEFRSKREHPGWRAFWDWSFFAGSTGASLVFGVAIGNAMMGLPLSPEGDFAGSFFDLLNPYGLLIGGFAVSMFALHGALFLNLKTEGALQARLRGWIWLAFGLFLVLYVLATISTLMLVPHATANFAQHPWAIMVVLCDVLAIANIPRCVYRSRPGQAFLSSAIGIAGLLTLFGLALFPNLITASNDSSLSVTIFNAASSAKTLGIMLVIAAIGMPLVLAYTVIIYRAFRGKVRLGHHSY